MRIYVPVKRSKSLRGDGFFRWFICNVFKGFKERWELQRVFRKVASDSRWDNAAEKAEKREKGQVPHRVLNCMSAPNFKNNDGVRSCLQERGRLQKLAIMGGCKHADRVHGTVPICAAKDM